MTEACEAWRSLSDRTALGEDLREEEEAFLRLHPARCHACGTEAELWTALGSALERPELLSAVRPSRAEIVTPARGWRGSALLQRRALGAAVATVVAAAAAALLWLVTADATPAPPLTKRDNAVRPPVIAPHAIDASLVLVAGATSVNRVSAGAGRALVAGDQIAVTAGRACLSVPPAVTVCAEEGAELRVEKLEQRERLLRLQGGHAVARLGRQPPGARFGFLTEVGTVVAQGTVFSVKAGGGHVALRVHEGTVLQTRSDETKAFSAPEAALLSSPRAAPATDSIWSSDKPLLALSERFSERATSELVVTGHAGQVVLLDDQELGITPLSALLLPGSYRLAMRQGDRAGIAERVLLTGGGRLVKSYLSAPAPALAVSAASGGMGREVQASTPGDLLADARALRQQARYRSAAAAYERLLRQHPGSSEARAAAVSLGELQLSQLGDARGALRSFESYLRAGGPLSQEAGYGRIRALQKLGRNREAQQAIQAYLAAYPQSAQAATLRKGGR